MIDTKKLLRRSNIKIKDFIGNKITLFSDDDLTKAEDLFRKNKIDFKTVGRVINVTDKSLYKNEDTTSADIASDTVIKYKNKKRGRDDVEGEEEGVKKNDKNSLLGSDIYNIIQRRVSNKLVNESLFSDITHEYEKINKILNKGTSLTILGIDGGGHNIERTFNFNNLAVAKALVKKLKFIFDF